MAATYARDSVTHEREPSNGQWTDVVVSHTNVNRCVVNEWTWCCEATFEFLSASDETTAANRLRRCARRSRKRVSGIKVSGQSRDADSMRTSLGFAISSASASSSALLSPTVPTVAIRRLHSSVDLATNRNYDRTKRRPRLRVPGRERARYH